ncbi:MAG: efflux RND transporter periplasmic adaptor subunit, partial [Gammaproteobacteria bacterium]
MKRRSLSGTHSGACGGITILVLLTLLLNACQQQPDTAGSAAPAHQESALEHAKKHLEPKYVCPMHP